MRIWMIIGAAALAAQPLLASPAPPPASRSQKVDPAALAAADRVLTAMGYERMMQRACDAMVAQVGPMLKKGIEAKTGEQIDDELIERLTEGPIRVRAKGPD